MNKHLHNLHKHPSVLILGLFVVILSVYVLVEAISNNVKYEAESGTRANNAALITDSNASGGSAVRFNASGGASCGVSTPNVPDGPDPLGGCFPGAINTGIPAGTTLTTYTGSCTITSPVTIDSKTINCHLEIQAAGVVITKSKINGHISIDTDTNRTWSLTLTDSEVNAINSDGIPAISNGNAIVLRANIHGGHNGLQCEEHSAVCSVKESWIHGQFIAPGSEDHLGGVADFGHVVTCTGASAGGVPSCMELVHNSIICDAAVTSAGGGCTGDVNMLTQWGPLHGAIVQNNLLGANIGSAYCTYGGYNGSNASDHIIYTGNIFQRGTNHICAAFGPVTSFKFAGTGNVWTNNKYDDGTSLVCTAADECL